MTSRVVLFCSFVFMIGFIQSSPMDEQKPLDCPENEYYTKCSISVCQQNCRDLFVPSPCPGVSPDCFIPACVCKEEYFRSDKGVCVLADKCEPHCRDNEEYVDCTYNVCRPQFCFDKGLKRDCVEVDKDYCKPGCICKENYLMENGRCIPEEQCKPLPPAYATILG